MNLQESRIEALQNIAKLSRSVRCFVADLFLCCRKEKNVVNCNCCESCKSWYMNNECLHSGKYRP